MVDVIHFDDGISDAGFSVFVPDHSFDSSVHLLTNIDKCIDCIVFNDSLRCLDIYETNV